MALTFFDQLSKVFKLMAENKLKKDIDDTLLEKLLTFIMKCRLETSDTNCNRIVISQNDQADICLGFIKELVNRTEALYLIEKVISSVVAKNENYTVATRSFTIKFLGLILKSPERIFPYENLLQLLKYSDDEVVTDHIPSVQDALIICLSCITKQFVGALWFIDNNLKDFVFSSFNSSSYYVRKSAMNFFINFILHWTPQVSYSQHKKPEEIYLENFIKCLVSFIINHIHLCRNSREIIFAECCIFVLRQLLELNNIENIIGDHLSFARNVSECFMNLIEEKELNGKLIDLLVTVYLRFSLPDEVVKDVIKCLIMKEDIKLATDLASSFVSITRIKQCCPDEIQFFLFPLHILMNTPLSSCKNIFGVKPDFVYNIMLKKMNDKSECKVLFSTSLSALQKIACKINFDNQRQLGVEMLKLSKCSNYSQHKWLYSVLEDRIVHHSIIEFYSYLLSDDVYPSMKSEKSDLIFQSILQFLKKQTTDCNFLCQLLLLIKDVLILHRKHKVELEESEMDDLIQILCRMLHDKRESVVDSAIHLAGQIINLTAWKDKISKQGIHSVIWDIAIQGSHDGTIRSTALNVIINGCLETWFLNEVKISKGVTEIDIAKIFFDLTHDPDFFIQREALSCLFQWMKSKWNEFQHSSKDYLYTALVSSIKSLDLELKLTALDVWLWLLENEFTISPSLDVKKYVEHLINSGFGLSMILAFEDYDQAVQYKSATILCKLKEMLIGNGNSFDSLKLSYSVEDETTNSTVPQNEFEPISKEEKDKGINIVIEQSTTEQITNICRPSSLCESYDFKHEYFYNDNKSRICSVSSFWTCLWSENVISILQPDKIVTDITKGESLLNDIISARIVEYDFTEDTHDCY